MKKVLLAVCAIGAIGFFAWSASSQQPPFSTAPFIISIGLTVSSCGGQTLTAGQYSQITVSTTQTAC